MLVASLLLALNGENQWNTKSLMEKRNGEKQNSPKGTLDGPRAVHYLKGPHEHELNRI